MALLPADLQVAQALCCQQFQVMAGEARLTWHSSFALLREKDNLTFLLLLGPASGAAALRFAVC